MPDRHFQSGDLTLRYRAEGEGPAIVFLHGWTFDLDLWEPQAIALADSMRVLRFDRRGFGGSSGAPDRERDADDLVALLDHWQVARAVLVGMSQGARMALAFALAHPDRVAALVLDGPPDCFGAGEPEADGDLLLKPLRALARDAGMDAFRRAWRAHPLMRLHGDDESARALRDRMLARYPGTDLLQPDPASAPPLDAKALAHLAMPILVINGEFDTPARLRAGERLQRALPRAEHVVLPGAGHLANLDNPAAYNGALRAFLGRQSRAAA